ncbi:ATP-binding cassette domain-containing protein [Dactylosporangium sp. AC04546]|uniref:ABC transporter permease subunit n=1 Tax=Dactylosporangium sp. AC04546 TaxID=2862460 RepID=UPI002E7B8C5C|nr:ATP-binding cassette domain-containing protein [Dactylosporangium sp. AC04546]WVK86917.1 ATP-binding cassette domain-containing protein [Dactylosporangium sp. AC04546]
MTQLWTFIIVGLTAGGAYALTAIGVVTIYRGSGVLNFAHGAIGMAGTYVFWTFYSDGAATHGLPSLAEWPVGAAMAIGVGAGAVLGLLTYLLVMYPLRNASELARVIATLGVLLIVQNVALLIYSSEAMVVPRFLGRETVRLFGAPLRYDSAIVLAVVVVLAIGLTLLFRLTRLGLSATALQVQPVAAATLGISPHPAGIITWTLGGSLAAAAGILVVPAIGLSPTKLTLLINYALAASLVAKFRNYFVTVVVALAMGIAESVMILYNVPDWIRLTTPFAVILVALVAGGTAVPGRGFAESRLPRAGTGRLRPVTTAIWLGVATFVALGFTDGWSISVANAAIAALVSLAIVIVTGYAGQISLATYAFMGIGALLGAHTAGTWGLGYPMTMLLGTIGGGVAGLLIGLPAIRVRGIDLTVTTLVFSIVIANTVFVSATFIGSAYDGVVVPAPTLFGLDIDPGVHPGRFTILCLGVLLLVGIGILNLRRSAAGRRLLAVRANERGAAALGISVGGAKVAAFALGGAVAGLAGSLAVFRSRTITFADFDVFRSIFALAFTIVSGVGYVAGALYAGVISAGGPISYLFHGLSTKIDLILAIASGLLVVQIMLQHADGIIPLVSHQTAWIRDRLRRRRPRTEPAGHGPDDLTEPEHVAPSPAPPGDALLRVDGLSLRYGPVCAVDKVSLDVRPGEVIGVIGPNGAGKTSLIDSITGFAHKTEGTIHLDGVDISEWNIRRRARAGLGRTFQNLELFSDLTVRENLLAAHDPRGVAAYLVGWVRPGSDRLSGAAAQAVSLLGLQDCLDTEIRTLPQGTRQLVAVARALSARPRVLCLDEPAAGLDQAERDAMSRAIRLVVERLHIGVLLIEHNIDVVSGLCDRVVVLDFGAVVAHGLPSEVLASDVVRQAYLGTGGAPHRLDPVAAGDEVNR